MDHQCNEVNMCKWVYGFECDTLKLRMKTTNQNQNQNLVSFCSKFYMEMNIKVHKLEPELRPQDPSHGFRQRSAIHDLSDGQSELTTHSGLQFGGDPM